jgi:hypothetical protein
MTRCRKVMHQGRVPEQLATRSAKKSRSLQLILQPQSAKEHKFNRARRAGFQWALSYCPHHTPLTLASFKGARTAGFSSSSSQMSPDAAGGVMDTRVWGTGQSTSLSGALCMDGTRVAWRLHWSQRLSLISSALTLRRSSFVTVKPINQADKNKVADIAHWPDIAEERGFAATRIKAYYRNFLRSRCQA